jgi:hypothetical protein
LGFTLVLPNFRSIAPPYSRRTLGWLGIAANVLPSISAPDSAQSLPERQKADPEKREERDYLEARIRRIRE